MVSEYLLFENQEVIALALGFLMLIIVFYIFSRVTRNRATSLLVAIAISGIATWGLYRNRFYGYESTLVVLIYVVIAVIMLRIIWAFIRGTKRRFRF